MYKRQKYFCEFDDNWLNVEEYKCWLKKIDKYNAQCFLCKSSFTTKTELCIKFNFSMTCPQFYNHISKDRKLIECAKSEKKYDFLK